MSRTLSGLQAVLLGTAILVGMGLIGVAVFAVGSRQWFWDDALDVRAGFANVQGVEVGTRSAFAAWMQARWWPWKHPTPPRAR